MLGETAMSPMLRAGPAGWRAWRLLDLMRPFHAVALLVMHEMAGTHKIHELVPRARFLSLLDRAFGWEPTPANEARMSLQDRAQLRAAFAYLENECAEMELASSLATVRRIMHELDRDGCRYGEVWRHGGELRGRLIDDLENRLFLSFSIREAELYQSPRKGWEAVVERFPGATSDIEEASKCLALGRYTAAVFHLMRVMEIGLQAVRRCLSIPEPVKPAEKNWGVALRNVKDELAQRKTAGWASPDDASLFDEVYVSLDAVRNAWRNATMHVENKYTEEEAEHISGAVRAFMRKIAGRMDEQGLPHA